MRPRSPAHRWQLLILWLCTVFVACGEPEAQRYELRGQILALRPEASEVLIKHGDIENFMPGMTMPFKVRNARLLDGMTVGDLVTAELRVGKNEAWIAALEKTGSAAVEAPAAIPAASFIAPLAEGDAVPDTVLTDQEGRPLSLGDWRGRAVAVTFIYLRCPLPQFCPLMDRRFAEVQLAVERDPALADRVRLLSVSFDPEADTPAALAAHAAKLGAHPARWRFATAPAATIDRFAAHFGVNVIREADRTITHNLRTALVGPDGRIAAIHGGSDWTADQLVAELRRALAAS
jgi:protein SCO1/2